MKPAQPLPIVVAKAMVKGAPKIELQPLGDIQVRARQPVLVKCLYRLEEVSKERENWQFRLTSKIGSQAPAPASADWKDRWGRNDSLWGVLQQEFLFDEPGTYEASFQVDCSYREQDWSSDALKNESEKTVRGKFRIQVL